MKIESQVCTLEQAKRLKELGITENGLFKHVNRYKPNGNYYWEIDNSFSTMKGDLEYCPAFTVAELGAMLPILTISVEQKAGGYGCMIFKSDCNDVDYRYNIQSGKIEAEARAAMLIYLLENNIVTASDCNARLNN